MIFIIEYTSICKQYGHMQMRKSSNALQGTSRSKKKKSYPGFGMTSIDISSNISIYNWEDIL